jgi:hypothetical protein
VYAPSKISENSKLLPNSAPQFKIVDPRLTYEFKVNTESEDFHIINFETLTQILINKSKGGFIEFAKALQIATFQEIEIEDESQKEKDEPIVEQNESFVNSSNKCNANVCTSNSATSQSPETLCVVLQNNR